ncbi:MAG: hypothetical protein AAF672_08310 [Pseudomonadota bacterium]
MSLNDQAIEILMGNDRGGYTIPTKGLYPYQWNWDSAFIALGIAKYDEARAWAEITSLIDGQWPDGMIPSIIFRSDDPDYFPGPSRWGQTPGTIPSTGVSQPPVLASVVWQLNSGGSADELARIGQVFDPLVKWHRWFQANRVMHGATVTAHPWETGRDNCPEWNIGLETMEIAPDLAPYERMDNKHVNPRFRPTQAQYDKYLTIVQRGRDMGWDQNRLLNEGPFLMADPTLHFVLMRANRDLKAMAALLGEDTTEIDSWIAAGEAGAQYMWNEPLGAFTARDAKTGEFSTGFSNASPLCFYAGAGTPEQRGRIMENMQRIAGKVKFMLPSWDPDSDEFEAQRYWCGPVWPQMNYMVAEGLTMAGEPEMAGRVRDDLSAAIRQSGFWECFNPLTGEGCVGNNFSWTAAVWLTWHGPEPLRGAA